MLADLEREQRRLRRSRWSARRIALWCALVMVLGALVIGLLVGALWLGGPNVSPQPSQLDVQDELGDRATLLVIPEQRARGVRSTTSRPSVDDAATAVTPSGQEVVDRAASTPPEELLPTARPRKEESPAGSAMQPRLQIPPGLKSRATSCVRTASAGTEVSRVTLELSARGGEARLRVVRSPLAKSRMLQSCLDRLVRRLTLPSDGVVRFEVSP